MGKTRICGFIRIFTYTDNLLIYVRLDKGIRLPLATGLENGSPAEARNRRKATVKIRRNTAPGFI